MRTKLLSALLLASTALAGVASASPIIRDHRYQQPTVATYQPQRRDYDRDRDRDRDRDDHRPRVTYPSSYRAAPSVTWSGGVQVTARPSWMPQVNYGYQLDADGDEVQPYAYGQDPYVEGIARGEWYTLAAGTSLAYEQNGKINVELSGQPLQALELQATGGQNFIREVHVLLDNGQEIKLATNRVLDVMSAPNLRLDLGAQGSVGVRSIEIFGYSSGGQFRVLGA